MEYYAKCKIDGQCRIAYKAFIDSNSTYVFSFHGENPDLLLLRKYHDGMKIPFAVTCRSDEKGRICLPKRLCPKGAEVVWISFEDEDTAILEFH